MRIKFGMFELEIEEKPEPEPKEETFHERFRRESREFHEDFARFRKSTER